jgi:hypothetical protein
MNSLTKMDGMNNVKGISDFKIASLKIVPWELKEMAHWVSAIKISIVSRSQDQSLAVQMHRHSKMCDETAERNVPAVSLLQGHNA